MSKKVTLLFCFVVGFVLLSILAVGCSTTKGHGDAGTILSYQQQIDRLEEELRTRDRTIENAVRELGAITSRSEAMEGSVDELIELFEEYQRRVNRLLYDYDKVRTETKDKS